MMLHINKKEVNEQITNFAIRNYRNKNTLFTQKTAVIAMNA